MDSAQQSIAFAFIDPVILRIRIAVNHRRNFHTKNDVFCCLKMTFLRHSKHIR